MKRLRPPSIIQFFWFLVFVQMSYLFPVRDSAIMETYNDAFNADEMRIAIYGSAW